MGLRVRPLTIRCFLSYIRVHYICVTTSSMEPPIWCSRRASDTGYLERILTPYTIHVGINPYNGQFLRKNNGVTSACACKRYQAAFLLPPLLHNPRHGEKAWLRWSLWPYQSLFGLTMILLIIITVFLHLHKVFVLPYGCYYKSPSIHRLEKPSVYPQVTLL